jgi:hypothetical protein
MHKCNYSEPRESHSGFEYFSAKMDVFYPFCVHWHRKMPCNCDGTEQLRINNIYFYKERENDGISIEKYEKKF